MMMTPSTERRAIAFIRTIANRCAGCLRRSEENCRPCESAWANEIIKSYEAEGAECNNSSAPSLANRIVKILAVLGAATNPLPADKIDLGPKVSPQLKYWTLQILVRRGIVRRVRMKWREQYNSTYGYSLSRRKKEKTHGTQPAQRNTNPDAK